MEWLHPDYWKFSVRAKRIDIEIGKGLLLLIVIGIAALIYWLAA